MSSNAKIRVKISPAPSSEDFYKYMGELAKKTNYEFILDESQLDCDYWVIVHDFKYSGSARCPKENIIFITGEPPSVKKYSKRYLQQFGIVITSQKSLSHPNVIDTHQLLSWTFNKTRHNLVSLEPFEKPRNMSIVSSNKRFSREHEQRYQFALSLKNRLGNDIDFYGRGIRSFNDKWDVLAPYKFSIAIENSCNHNYISEKLTECFLSYTFPLYYGCPNVDDYYPKGSYEWIDITDFDGALELIYKINSNTNYYQNHLSNIQEARQLYLDKYDLHPLLLDIISSDSNHKSCLNQITTDVSIHSSNVTMSDLVFKIWCIYGLFKNKRDSFLKS